MSQEIQINSVLLCTDLDRTLLPNGSQSESETARKLFSNLVSHSQVTLAYVTGRHQQLIEQAIEEYQLPEADFVIADVGSTIYKITASHWKYLDEWEAKITQDWQGQSTGDLHELFANIQGLKLQEQSKQNNHKLSYYVALNKDQRCLIDKMKQVLQQHDIAANFIWSIDEQLNVGLLDVLPASAGKRQAIEFLIQYLGFEYSNTVFAGDSGNDLCVMSSAIPSVLVANANESIKRQALQQAQSNHHANTLYIAQGGFMNLNGNYSAGILEGVVHYFPQAEQWILEKQ